MMQREREGNENLEITFFENKTARRDKSENDHRSTNRNRKSFRFDCKVQGSSSRRSRNGGLAEWQHGSNHNNGIGG